MRLFPTCLATALCLVSPICSAIYTYSFGDLKSCRYDAITNEFAEYSDLFMKWNEMAQDLNRLMGQDESKWGVYYTSSAATDFASIGICRTLYTPVGSPFRFECRSESLGEFPLASAVFNLRTNVDLPTYQCVQGCNKNVPSVIFDNGYEAPQSRDLDIFLKKLERTCGKKLRKW